MTEEELSRLTVSLPDGEIEAKIKRKWDCVAKPLDSMGEFERITARIGAIQGSTEPDIRKKAVLVMCADNGIVEEGISQSGQEVTGAVAAALGENRSSVSKMAAYIGAQVIPVDIGINTKQPISGVLDRKIRRGTRNFLREPAMTAKETLAAVSVGMELVRELKEQGYGILATGEMGIGNTTTSSAVAAALMGLSPQALTGRGAGLGDDRFLRKKQVIREALQKYDFYTGEPFRILQSVGGLDLAGMTGIFLGGAVYHMPVVADGLISITAALLAQRLVPGAKEYVIFSHVSREPAAELLLRELDGTAVIHGGLALGEGTGAVMMLALLDMALTLYHGQTTFGDLQIEQYQRFETKEPDKGGGKKEC